MTQNTSHAVMVRQIGNATLYLGDCLKILSTVEKAHLIVSDPPYRLTTGGLSLSSKTMSGIFAAHNYANDGQLVIAAVDWRDMAGPLHAALVDNADAYIMANDKNVGPALQAFTSAGFGLHNILTWDKITPTANRWYMKNIEFTLYFWKGQARTINNPGSKQGVSGRQIDESGHPTEKPVWLMQHYIENSSQVGEIVLDPFMGSGSTGVAALKSGRRFIGIELEKKYFDMACRRIECAMDQVEMFAAGAA